MRLIHSIITSVILLFLVACQAETERPNVLLIIGDDISRTSLGVYGCKYIETPHLDRIANEGVLFTNAYVCNPKCAPSRAGLLTGRYSWQLEEATNHNGVMPEKWKFYPELLEGAGYTVGFTGKGWGHGHYYGEYNPAGWEYNDIKCTPPYATMSSKDYAANFELFLDKKQDDKPFCFWLGTHEAHRAFTKDSYKNHHKDLSKVQVQKCFPDNEVLRGDLADYGLEVEYHDKHVGLALKLLEERGLLDNTLIIATSDHGMAFPHIKGQIYDEGFRVPFVVRWGNKIKSKRIVTDFINFPDVAPTIMQAVGLIPHQQMTGKSFLDVLLSSKSGRVDEERTYALLGKERHDIGRCDGELLTVGYPVRALRDDKFLYAHNYKNERWPAGDPEYGYKNCDASPTMSYLLSLTEEDPDFKYYELSFAKRPSDELYDMVNDPDCIHNLAYQPEFTDRAKQMKAKMEALLSAQNDPRVLGQGDIFDDYPHGRPDKLIPLYGEKYYDMYEAFYKKYNKHSAPIPSDSLKINKSIIRNYMQNTKK